MRIIKLSEKIFNSSKSITNYFTNDLIKSVPPGKFRFTKGRIAKDGIRPNEKILFSYKGTIYYKAISLSGRIKNSDNYSSIYPYYFQVDTNSISSIKISLHEFEEKYHKIAKDTKSIVQSQGWPSINNENYEDILWNYV